MTEIDRLIENAGGLTEIVVPVGVLQELNEVLKRQNTTIEHLRKGRNYWKRAFNKVATSMHDAIIEALNDE